MVAATPPTPPSVTVARPCYAEGDRIALSGKGFTPNGAVRLTLERSGQPPLADTAAPQADDAGYVEGAYGVEADTGWFGGAERRFTMRLRLTDVAAPALTASTAFTFSRWNVGVRSATGRIEPRRPARLSAVGFTGDAGKPLYAHYLRGTQLVRTVRLGTLRGSCGTLTKTLARGFPFGPVRPGSWQVTFNTSRRNAHALDTIVVRAARVKRTIP